MSGSKLDVLRQHRDALLLAEVGAWLHDMGKCSDDFIVHQASDCPSGRQYRYKTAQSRQLPSPPPDVDLLNEKVSIKDLIESGMPKIIKDTSKPWILRVLGRCHAVAHVEKELDEHDKSNKQPWGDTRLSSAFGLEDNPVSGLTARLAAVPFGSLMDRNLLVQKVEEAFTEALGDTRRPINEVTLADWSATVAGLYKSAIAGALLGVQPDPDGLRWRLLRVNFDVLGFYAKAIKIADLLAYEDVAQRACERAKHLIESEYPLGNEVYRDSTGIYFLFPDIDLWPELCELLRITVEKIEPELMPRIKVGAPLGNTVTEHLRNLLHHQRGEASKALVYPSDDENYNPRWEGLWNNAPSNSEICPVCRLRPMREGEEACGDCLQRRQSRINAWKKTPSRTIWLDEVADHNHRVALLVGKFGLEDWLSGDLVQTLLVKAVENDPSACVPKNPSPARLRRVWETCRRFWTDTVEKQILENHEYGEDSTNVALRRTRLFVTPDFTSNWKENVPYDGAVSGQPVSLLWRAAEMNFVTVINLQLAAGAVKTPQELQQRWSGCDAEIGDPGNPRRRIRFKIEAVTPATHSWAQYRPHLSLLASPDQFLALIPARDSLEIAKKIQEEYQKQFGKVQNRLPLFLGLVFFNRKSPLMAALDSARRMLKQVEFHQEPWQIGSSCPSADGFTRHLRLSRNGERISYDIPVKMGDGKTDDIWYPYFFFEGEPVAPSLRFRHNSRWLVHINDLHDSDKVLIKPARFAYMYLEHTAQRFEFDLEKDAMLLDELPQLAQMWKEIREAPDMTNTRLQAIHALFETKRVAWRVGDDTAGDRKTFRHLVETTLKHNKLDKLISPEDVMHGRFGRCLDLHMKILKVRVQEGESEQQPEDAIA